MEMNNLHLEFETASDGVEAFKYLEKAYKSDSTELPDIILLDLNMPRMNGHEFVKKIKVDDRLKKIPIVILTTSKSDEDIIKSYTQGVSCYLTKPLGLAEFQKVVEALNNFWFTIVKFPDRK
jgi:two-component system response regulator